MPLALTEGERQFVSTPTHAGQPASILDGRFCRLYGRALAEVHTATDDFTSSYLRCDVEQLLERPVNALATLLDAHPEEREFLRGFADRLRERIARLPAGTLDRGYCHGDARPANAHMADDRALTLFDFEVGGMGARAYDLATFLFALGGAPAGSAMGLRETFLEGYAERRPLTQSQREAVELFVPLRPIRILGNILQTAYANPDLECRPLREGQARPSFLDVALPFLREWEADDRAHRGGI